MKNITVEAQKFNDRILAMDGISKKTVEEHLKLYQGYVAKYNEIDAKLAGLGDDDYAKANQVFSVIRELKVELSFAWGGIINHEIYFNHLGGKGGTPEGDLLKQIENDWGGFDMYLKDLKASAISARGWVWTAWNSREKRLFNYVGDSQNTYLTWETKPVLALDTYEHAYFIDYGVNRGQYVEAFLKNIDWNKVTENLQSAMQ